MTTTPTLRTTNKPKINQKAKVATADVCLQVFVKILEEFKDVPY